MPGQQQLFAISQIGKNLRNDYRSLTAIATNPPELNSLVPYIKITDKQSNTLLYNNTKWVHTIAGSDIIVDLLSMDIEVGKNGYPSIISGTVKFKILNANKFITPENEIRVPQLFSIMTEKNLKFGWNNANFTRFDEDVLEMKFESSTESQNTGIITMHVGSTLTYFNKVDHVFATNLKDTSTINTKPRQSFELDYNGKVIFSEEVITNLVDHELKKPFGDISYLWMFDNIMYYFDKEYPYKKYSTEEPSTYPLYLVGTEELYGIKHLYAKWFSVDYGANLVRLRDGDDDGENDIYRFSGYHQQTETWYGHFVDFSSFDVADAKELAIIPRISLYQDIQDNETSQELYALRGKLYDTLNAQSNLYPIYLRDLEKSPELELYSDSIEEPFRAVPNLLENEYYAKFLFSTTNSPFVKNYHFTPDGQYEILAKGNRTIERERIETLMRVHIQYILELRKLAGELYSTNNSELVALDIKHRIRDIYNKLSDFIIDDPEFIELLKPKELSVQKHNFNTIHNYDFWERFASDLGLIEQQHIKPTFGISTPDVRDESSIRAVDLVTLLELNYRLRSNKPLYFYSSEWTTFLQSLDDFSKKTEDDEKIKKQKPNDFELQYFYTSNNLTSIHDCIIYLATQINKLYGRSVVQDWEGSYYTIMIETAEDSQIELAQEEEQEKGEPVSELNADKEELFSWYEERNNLRLIDITTDLNRKLNEGLEPKYQVQLSIYGGSPNLVQDREYEIRWDDESEKKITLITGYEEGIEVSNPNEYRLENILLPKTVYDNMWADSGSLFELLNKIFAHYREHFNLNLSFSVYRHKDTGITEIEIFCLDLLKKAVDTWDGGTDFSQIYGTLGDRFIALDYRANNSIVTKISANTQTQDSLFLAFMPAQSSDSILALFETGAKKKENLPESALDDLQTVFTKVFKPANDSQIPGYEGMFRQVQQYVKDKKLGTLIEDGNLKKDIDFLEAILRFYNASGTYPAQLLFGGYSITLELVGLNGFASFQLIGLRNSGIYDGIYMVEKASHHLDKSTFSTKLDCKLLAPRIRAFANSS